MIEFNGSLFVAGGLPNVGDVIVSGIARWDGARWNDMPGVLRNASPSFVYALRPWGGQLYVAGEFSQTDPERYIVNNIMGWNGVRTTGQLGNARSENTLGAGGAARVLANLRGVGFSNNLYVGGEFTKIGGNGLVQGTTVNHIARFSDLIFQSVNMGDGVNGTVRTIERFNSIIYIGGSFTAGGAATSPPSLSRIASWNGSAWEQVGGGLFPGLNGTLYALKSFNGSLYTGGSFTQAGLTNTGGLARWNGSAWSSVGGNFSGTVYAHEIYNNQLIIGG